MILAAVDVGNNANKLVDHDIVHSTLEVQLQILPLITVELSVDDDNANFLR